MPLSHKGCLGMLLIFQGDGSPTGLKRRAGEEKKRKKEKKKNKKEKEKKKTTGTQASNILPSVGHRL